MIENYYKKLKEMGELPITSTLLDLGGGNGRFSKPFVKAGWNVVLVDKEASAISEARKSLVGATLIQQDINEYLLENVEKSQIIIVNNVLPFLGPKLTEALDLIYEHLENQGILIGVFFGVDDPWNDKTNDLVFNERSEALSFLSKYKILEFEEIREPLPLINGEMKNWHRFEFIVKKS